MRLYTTKILAQWLDLTERAVRDLKKRGIIHEYKGREGLYQLRESVVDYINYLRNKNPGLSNLDYNQERAKLVKTKRETAELELAERKNELHKSEDIEVIMSDMLIRFRTRLMAIPAKQSPILAEKKDQKEIFKILKDAIDEAMEELSDYNAAFEGGSAENDGKTDDTAI